MNFGVAGTAWYENTSESRASGSGSTLRPTCSLCLYQGKQKKEK